ncbi:hypothetical protein JKP88DRAFT_254213 [Tribonema minus]|uniref:Uncharacterized protein n=1 Tax=Tribonema minus TaxID=303371 RepID=A0A835ZDP2_9STRA|nr:hypothetical protein JKP88DRAFT_254213 [Tribonema minus]
MLKQVLVQIVVCVLLMLDGCLAAGIGDTLAAYRTRFTQQDTGTGPPSGRQKPKVMVVSHDDRELHFWDPLSSMAASGRNHTHAALVAAPAYLLHSSASIGAKALLPPPCYSTLVLIRLAALARAANSVSAFGALLLSELAMSPNTHLAAASALLRVLSYRAWRAAALRAHAALAALRCALRRRSPLRRRGEAAALRRILSAAAADIVPLDGLAAALAFDAALAAEGAALPYAPAWPDQMRWWHGRRQRTARRAVLRDVRLAFAPTSAAAAARQPRLPWRRRGAQPVGGSSSAKGEQLLPRQGGGLRGSGGGGGDSGGAAVQRRRRLPRFRRRRTMQLFSSGASDGGSSSASMQLPWRRRRQLLLRNGGGGGSGGGGSSSGVGSAGLRKLLPRRLFGGERGRDGSSSSSGSGGGYIIGDLRLSQLQAVDLPGVAACTTHLAVLAGTGVRAEGSSSSGGDSITVLIKRADAARRRYANDDVRALRGALRAARRALGSAAAAAFEEDARRRVEASADLTQEADALRAMRSSLAEVGLLGSAELPVVVEVGGGSGGSEGGDGAEGSGSSSSGALSALAARSVLVTTAPRGVSAADPIMFVHAAGGRGAAAVWARRAAALHAHLALADGLCLAAPHPAALLLARGGTVGFVDPARDARALPPPLRQALCRLYEALGARKADGGGGGGSGGTDGGSSDDDERARELLEACGVEVDMARARPGATLWDVALALFDAPPVLPRAAAAAANAQQYRISAFGRCSGGDGGGSGGDGGGSGGGGAFLYGATLVSVPPELAPFLRMVAGLRGVCARVGADASLLPAFAEAAQRGART